MKVLIGLLVLAVLVYFIFTGADENVPVSPGTDKVYAEVRINLTKHGREFHFVLFGEATGDADCQTRTERVWRKVFSGCPECTVKAIRCVSQIEPRYQLLWRNEPTYIKYFSFTKGTSGERNGRMITWGVSMEESVELCKQLIPKFRKTYAGKIECL